MFIEIIDDIDAFLLMLDGAFNEWAGIYDVLLTENDTYLYSDRVRENFNPFCNKLREKQEGLKRCLECDKKASKESAKKHGSIVYTCHSGLKDIAIPIFIRQEHIATILCGQVILGKDELNEENINKVHNIEKELDFKKDELVSLFKLSPLISKDKINRTIKRIEKLVNYLSILWLKKIELNEAYNKEKLRLSENKKMEEIVSTLLCDFSGEEEFLWSKVEHTLKSTLDIIGAECAMVLIPNRDTMINKIQFIIKASVKLPVSYFKGNLYSNNDELLEKIGNQDFKILPFENSIDTRTIIGNICHKAPSLINKIDKLCLCKIRLTSNNNGYVLFLIRVCL